MELLTLQEARDALRIDGEDNDTIIQSLMGSLPDYLQMTTGSTWQDNTAAGYQLAKRCACFILQLWYDPSAQEAAQLQAVIDRMLGTLQVMVHNG